MIFCQALLVVFAVQWLISQYKIHEVELKSDLARLFTDVQDQVSDSLLLNKVYNGKIAGTAPAVSPKQLQQGENNLSATGLHSVLSGTNKLTKEDELKLFHIDTIAFNEMFVEEMKRNGWNFNSEWINNRDSNVYGQSIFIKSDFFTKDHGVIVSNYKGYIIRALLPQFLFIIVLLSLTAFAFFVAFGSLKSQMKLGKMKDDFISNMSHELKTPISTVKLVLEAMCNYGVLDDPEKSREYIGMATSEMDRLELLATRVLNTAVAENGTLSLNKENVDLLSLVQETIANMTMKIQKSNGSIALNYTGTNFTVPVDKLHIQGVLVNLIDNSLKYSNGTPHIAVALTSDGDRITLSLADDGPGIPEEYKEKIFEKFFRVPNGSLHNTKGYGLGLSYAAQVMRCHNGSIGVNNLQQGGCSFTLSF